MNNIYYLSYDELYLLVLKAKRAKSVIGKPSFCRTDLKESIEEVSLWMDDCIWAGYNIFDLMFYDDLSLISSAEKMRMKIELAEQALDIFCNFARSLIRNGYGESWPIDLIGALQSSSSERSLAEYKVDSFERIIPKLIEDEELEQMTNKVYYWLSKSLFFKGCDEEDLKQEIRISINLAKSVYRPEKSTFESFAYLVVKRQLITIIKFFNSQKNNILNGLHLDQQLKGCDMYRYIPNNREIKNIKNTLWDSVDLKRCHLTELEAIVMQTILEGHTYREAAEIMRLDEKQIDNALTRVRRKINNSLLH